MIIDQERKIIYLHNPKCGGTFLRNIYIEKNGETDATKWWLNFTLKYGTDLGHISYEDLPRFVPEYEEYRLFVMVRNPYNRFYSAFKEFKKQYGRIIFPSPYLYGGEYKEWNKYQKFIYYLKKICPGTYLVQALSRVPVQEFTIKLYSYNRLKQDVFLRNKRIPWLNPQSTFLGKKVTILHYESVSDWEILLNALGLSEYLNRVKIARDYDIPESICEMIRILYPEDNQLFSLYKNENYSCNGFMEGDKETVATYSRK